VETGQVFSDMSNFYGKMLATNLKVEEKFESLARIQIHQSRNFVMNRPSKKKFAKLENTDCLIPGHIIQQIFYEQ
jgi:hypothetical protein